MRDVPTAPVEPRRAGPLRRVRPDPHRVPAGDYLLWCGSRVGPGVAPVARTCSGSRCGSAMVVGRGPTSTCWPRRRWAARRPVRAQVAHLPGDARILGAQQPRPGRDRGPMRVLPGGRRRRRQFGHEDVKLGRMGPRVPARAGRHGRGGHGGCVCWRVPPQPQHPAQPALKEVPAPLAYVLLGRFFMRGLLTGRYRTDRTAGSPPWPCLNPPRSVADPDKAAVDPDGECHQVLGLRFGGQGSAK